jgi:glycogen debranching enzyme
MGILDAATYFRYRLPEVFAGYERELTNFPVEYPTASSPQAWATGTPLLLMRVILGLEPDGDELRCDPALPEKITRLELRGIPGRWGHADAIAAPALA